MSYELAFVKFMAVSLSGSKRLLLTSNFLVLQSFTGHSTSKYQLSVWHVFAIPLPQFSFHVDLARQAQNSCTAAACRSTTVCTSCNWDSGPFTVEHPQFCPFTEP